MKTELLRHFKILKTVPEIKESIEELKFGCNIFTKIDGYKRINTVGRYKGKTVYFFVGPNGGDDRINIKNDFEIIGQIEERHLRMFFEKIEILFKINEDGQMIFGDVLYAIYSDNSKSYMDQSEEFFKKLNDWMISEFNLKL